MEITYYFKYIKRYENYLFVLRKNIYSESKLTFKDSDRKLHGSKNEGQ